MDYGKVLTRAWEITWHWKVLWILGFLASLTRASTSGSNTGYEFSGSEWGSTYGPYIPPRVVALLVAITCLAFILAIALWVVSVIARGGLIAGVQQVEEEGSTRFGQAWRAGASRFWTLFGLSILTALPIFVLVILGIGVMILIILGTIGVFDTSEALGATGILASILCGGAICCGAIVLAIVLNQIRVYGERAAVLEGMGWIEAFVRGWHVLRENLLPTLIFWLIFLVLGFALGALIFAAILAFGVPFGFFAALGGPKLGGWMVAPICFGGLVVMIVLALIASIVETFISATWTLAYRELTGLAAAPVDETAEELADQPAAHR
jgi:hypothetical protein